MQATIDIPEPLYEVLQHEADRDGKSVGEVILHRIAETTPQVSDQSLPVTDSKSDSDALPFDMLILPNGFRIPQIRSTRTEPLDPTTISYDLFDYDLLP